VLKKKRKDPLLSGVFLPGHQNHKKLAETIHLKKKSLELKKYPPRTSPSSGEAERPPYGRPLESRRPFGGLNGVVEDRPARRLTPRLQENEAPAVQ